LGSGGEKRDGNRVPSPSPSKSNGWFRASGLQRISKGREGEREESTAQKGEEPLRIGGEQKKKGLGKFFPEKEHPSTPFRSDKTGERNARRKIK